MRELPDFSRYLGPDFDPRALAYIKICPSADYFAHSWDDARHGRPSRSPVMEVQIPTVYDPTLAPPGQHVMSIWVSYAPVQPRDGTWDTLRRPVGEHLIDTLATYAPNLREAIVDWSLFTPWDLEQRVGLTDGNIRHLDIVPSQFLGQRPLPGYADYRTPIDRPLPVRGRDASRWGSDRRSRPQCRGGGVKRLGRVSGVVERSAHPPMVPLSIAAAIERGSRFSRCKRDPDELGVYLRDESAPLHDQTWTTCQRVGAGWCAITGAREIAVWDTEDDYCTRSAEHAAVVGTGAWGLTLAMLLARNGVPTTLWARTADEASAYCGPRATIPRGCPT